MQYFRFAFPSRMRVKPARDTSESRANFSSVFFPTVLPLKDLFTINLPLGFPTEKSQQHLTASQLCMQLVEQVQKVNFKNPVEPMTSAIPVQCFD